MAGFIDDVGQGMYDGYLLENLIEDRDPEARLIKALDRMEEEESFDSDASDKEEDRAPSFITCVAKGHLFFSTDVEILEVAITEGDSLVGHSDYASVSPHLKDLGGDSCIQYFGRLPDALKVNYELLRLGKKPDAAKSFKGLLSNIAAGEPPEIDEPKLDGSLLPPARPGLGIEFDREAAKKRPFQMRELSQLRRLDGSVTNW